MSIPAVPHRANRKAGEGEGGETNREKAVMDGRGRRWQSDESSSSGGGGGGHGMNRIGRRKVMQICNKRGEGGEEATDHAECVLVS